jgi:hypothetical protein
MITRNQVIHALFNELNHQLTQLGPVGEIDPQDPLLRIANEVDTLHHDYTNTMRDMRIRIEHADLKVDNHDFEGLVHG